MALEFNPLVKKGFDKVRDLSSLISLFVQKTGDIMTGNLDLQDNYLILKDSNGIDWLLTVTTDGAVITTEVPGLSLLETGDFLLLEDDISKLSWE